MELNRELKCEEVWAEVSNYLDGAVEPSLRAAMDRHAARCRHCTAVIDGACNVVRLYGDGRLFTVPANFSAAWQQRIEARIHPQRGSAYMWILSLAGAGLVAATILICSLPRFVTSPLRAPMSQPANVPAIPAHANLVAVTASGKTFHVPGCPLIHSSVVKMMSIEEAMRLGYSPCTHCEHDLLLRRTTDDQRESDSWLAALRQ